MSVKIIRDPKKIALIGAPTSAGSHGPGAEKAPAALRAAGLVARLESAGYQVNDLGDGPTHLHSADDEHPRARNTAAVYWRKTPEFHRRLMLMATCALTAAAFGRFMPHPWFYVGVDVLILLGMLRDLLVIKRVHPVYLYGLPLIMMGQVATILTYVKSWPEWLKVAHALLG